MHIIIVSVTVSLIKIQGLIILRKGLLTELEKNKKIKKKRFSERQQHFLGRACFGWVYRSTENQHFFKVSLT